MTYVRQDQIREVHAQRRARTDQKANEAIDCLLREKLPINFSKVSERSGISVATLYKHDAIRKRIEFLRDEEKALPSARDRKSATSDEGKDAIIASLKRKIARLEAENQELREANAARLAKEWEEL